MNIEDYCKSKESQKNFLTEQKYHLNFTIKSFTFETQKFIK